MKVIVDKLSETVGYLMLRVDNPSLEELFDQIDQNDLHEKGVERDPHVTVVGNIPVSISPDSLLRSALGQTIEKLKLTTVTYFECEEYDVLKWDLDSDSVDELRSIHDPIVEKFKIEEKYPDYHPHSTIAYLKSGTGKKYQEKFSHYHDITVPAKDLNYSILQEL